MQENWGQLAFIDAHPDRIGSPGLRRASLPRSAMAGSKPTRAQVSMATFVPGRVGVSCVAAKSVRSNRPIVDRGQQLTKNAEQRIVLPRSRFKDRLDCFRDCSA